mgnify:CR=1 FL=1
MAAGPQVERAAARGTGAPVTAAGPQVMEMMGGGLRAESQVGAGHHFG